MKNQAKRVVALFLSLCLALSFAFTANVETAEAATKDVALAKKTINLTITKGVDKTTYGKVKIAVVKSKNVKIKKITYKSNDSKIAKVNSKGRVTAENKGSTTVKVKVVFNKNKNKYTKTLNQKVVVKLKTEKFSYKHDPTIYEKAMEDVVVAPDAIYGFAPNPESARLGEYAKYDWTDAKVVADGRADRIAYHKSIESMYDMLDELIAQEKDIETIARTISAERNRIRMDAYKDDPEGLEVAKKSNLEKYGNENGPTVESLYEKYGSWEVVLEKAFSPNIGMDICLGLFDEYFDSYVALGILPDTVTLEQFIKDNGKTYCSYESIAKKYGTFTVEYKQEDKLDNEVLTAKMQSDGKSTVVTAIDGRTYIRYNDEWYLKAAEGSAAELGKVVFFENVQDMLLPYLEQGLHDFTLDNGAKLTQTSSGYKYEYSCNDPDAPFENCTTTYTCNLNKDFSVKESSLVYTRDSKELYSEVCKYTYQIKMPEILDTLKNNLKASGGEVRHINYNYVKNGEVVKVFKTTVPKGFMCTANFSAEYAAGNDALYRDKELTIPLVTTKEELGTLLEIYVGEK